MTLTLAQIYRHPIKAHGSEQLNQVDLTADHTLPWDRVWAVGHDAATADADGSVWARCRNFTRGASAPKLMAVRCQFNETTGQITLTHPDLPDLSANPDTDGDKIIAWSKPLIPADRPMPSRVVRAVAAEDGQGMTDNPNPYVSLLTHASLRALGQKLGRDLSPLRFRGNLWLDGAGPWEEFEWVGKRLRLGAVELEVEDRIDRCRATEANPETGLRDADTLGALKDGWGHIDFGVFARVVTSGTVHIGDKLEVLS